VAWEVRNGSTYYYRPLRSGKRTYKQYIGTGPKAERAARLDAENRRTREAREAAWQQRKAMLQGLTASMETLKCHCQVLSYAVLTNLGCHWHRNSEWRVKRGQETQATRQAG
jgi:hypothetical protein